TLNIRGFSEQRLLEMVDGDRIQTATEHAGPLSTININNIERIEVIKGASSVLYGTGAMGGVVNFVTKTPAYTTTFKAKGNVGSEFNTVNNLWANFANVSFTTNQWYMALDGSFRTAQNTMTPAGPLLSSQFHDASWGLKAGVKYSANREFKANYQHFGGWDIGIPGGRTFSASVVARYTGISRNQLAGEYIISDLNDNLRQIVFKAYTQNISRDVELVPNSTNKLYPSSLNKTSGLKLTTDWQFTYYHSLTLGAEGWLRDAKTIKLTEKNNADTLLTVTGDLPTPHAKMYDAGVFAHYSWKIQPEKLVLNAGVRLDYIQTANDTAFSPLFKYTVKNNVATDVKNLPRKVLFVASVHEDPAYAAHVNLTFIPVSNQQFTLSLSNSYRAASIEERFKLIELDGPKHVGNPNLKPERGIFSNLGYTFLGGKLRLKADVYANYLNNLITEQRGTYTYIDADGSPTSETAFINVNISRALFMGVEFEGKWIWDKHFSMEANASHVRARDVDKNDFLPLIPPMNGFAAFNYQLERGTGVSVSALWAATQHEIAPGETATPGHVVYNVDIHGGGIALNKTTLQMWAGVNNLFDAAYTDHLSSNRGIVKLEPGRNIYVKIKLAWE
ncbi:MAG TPA: TonB-dependent receptor, partial [Paludibacter sp.]|nr:TonB-dependent receptor [Paludibacter sp.]